MKLMIHHVSSLRRVRGVPGSGECLGEDEGHQRPYPAEDGHSTPEAAHDEQLETTQAKGRTEMM